MLVLEPVEECQCQGKCQCQCGAFKFSLASPDEESENSMHANLPRFPLALPWWLESRLVRVLVDHGIPASHSKRTPLFLTHPHSLAPVTSKSPYQFQVLTSRSLSLALSSLSWSDRCRGFCHVCLRMLIRRAYAGAYLPTYLPISTITANYTFILPPKPQRRQIPPRITKSLGTGLIT